MGFTIIHNETPIEYDRAVIRCRRLATRLLGVLFSRYNSKQSLDVLTYLTQNLNFRSAVHRMVVGMIAGEWAKVSRTKNRNSH